MTIEEIRKGAPEGANAYFYDVFCNIVYVCESEQFKTYFNSKRKRWYMLLRVESKIKPL